MNTTDLLELYRAKAREAEERAALTVDAEERAKLLRIAEGFRNLLTHHEEPLQGTSATKPPVTGK